MRVAGVLMIKIVNIADDLARPNFVAKLAIIVPVIMHCRVYVLICLLSGVGVRVRGIIMFCFFLNTNK